MIFMGREDFKTAYTDSYHLLKDFTQTNRKESTTPEDVLWRYLRKEQLGCKFRRQHIIENYIADFICLKENLIIEVDGGYHQTEIQKTEDDNRTNKLLQMGYRVIRFTNEEVLFDIDNVISQIKQQLHHA